MYKRPMHCKKCETVTDHSVYKKTAWYQNGKQMVRINKICYICESVRESDITATSWIALLKQNYWGQDYRRNNEY